MNLGWFYLTHHTKYWKIHSYPATVHSAIKDMKKWVPGHEQEDMVPGHYGESSCD